VLSAASFDMLLSTAGIVCGAGLMTVTDVQLIDEGTYVCHASNGIGEVQSVIVFVRVHSELQTLSHQRSFLFDFSAVSLSVYYCVF